MWEDYAHRFRLRAPKVMSQSVAQRDLPNLVRYRLVIVDESHNFRNTEGKIYQAIQDYIARNDCKVILLSATPYNKTYLDLGAQLRLFLNEQHDVGIRPEAMLREISESRFALANPNTPVSSLGAYEKSIHPDDWRELMRLFLVRRTRSFIIKNYAEFDARNERHYLTLPSGERMYFPVRQPVSVTFRSDPGDVADPCARLMRDDVVGVINSLRLPRYGRNLYKQPPGKLPAELTPAENKILDDLSRAGPRMMGFCRTNLFKRLECSAHAFLLFTQFADTAIYLSDAIRQAGIDGVDCCTGQSEDPAKQAWRFSPESNDKLKEFPPSRQTRVLIATATTTSSSPITSAPPSRPSSITPSPPRPATSSTASSAPTSPTTTSPPSSPNSTATTASSSSTSTKPPAAIPASFAHSDSLDTHPPSPYLA